MPGIIFDPVTSTPINNRTVVIAVFRIADSTTLFAFIFQTIFISKTFLKLALLFTLSTLTTNFNLLLFCLNKLINPIYYFVNRFFMSF